MGENIVNRSTQSVPQPCCTNLKLLQIQIFCGLLTYNRSEFQIHFSFLAIHVWHRNKQPCFHVFPFLPFFTSRFMRAVFFKHHIKERINWGSAQHPKQTYALIKFYSERSISECMKVEKMLTEKRSHCAKSSCKFEKWKRIQRFLLLFIYIQFELDLCRFFSSLEVILHALA